MKHRKLVTRDKKADIIMILILAAQSVMGIPNRVQLSLANLKVVMLLLIKIVLKHNVVPASLEKREDAEEEKAEDLVKEHGDVDAAIEEEREDVENLKEAGVKNVVADLERK